MCTGIANIESGALQSFCEHGNELLNIVKAGVSWPV